MLHSSSVTPPDTSPTPLITGLSGPPGAARYGSTFAGFIVIQSRTGNSAPVTVTGQNVTTGAPSTVGVVLLAGEKVTLPWYGQPHGYNLANVYVITAGGSEVVDFVYGS